MEFNDKICLVTGASSPLGLEVSKGLARMGAHITLLCRGLRKGEQAIEAIEKEVPGAKLELMICDFSSLASIRRFIKEYKNRHNKLDLLFNNAAVMKKKRTITDDGFEMMFQVNYLAPFILMNSFTDLLKRGSSPQIINNALPAYKYRLDMDDLQFVQHYSMYRSFFLTKLCLLFAGLEYAQQHEDDGIATIMAVPGPFKSELVREVPLMGWFKNLFSAPASRAAENILYVITSDSIANKNGKLFNRKQEMPLSAYWRNDLLRERLWSITESLTRDTALV